MTSLFNTPVFAISTEKHTFQLPNTIGSLLPRLVEFRNKINAEQVRRASIGNPELEGVKAAELDAAALVEALLKDLLGNPHVANFLRTGEIDYDAVLSPETADDSKGARPAKAKQATAPVRPTQAPARPSVSPSGTPNQG